VGWIDQHLAEADHAGGAERVTNMRRSLLEPLTDIFGVSNKLWSMALAELLMGGDPARERWVTTGAAMIAGDTLVHNFLHRTDVLRRFSAAHSYGARCYAAGVASTSLTNSLVNSMRTPSAPASRPFFRASFSTQSGVSVQQGS
jgi:hypothetical protein